MDTESKYIVDIIENFDNPRINDLITIIEGEKIVFGKIPPYDNGKIYLVEPTNHEISAEQYFILLYKTLESMRIPCRDIELLININNEKSHEKKSKKDTFIQLLKKSGYLKTKNINKQNHYFVNTKEFTRSKEKFRDMTKKLEENLKNLKNSEESLKEKDAYITIIQQIVAWILRNIMPCVQKKYDEKFERQIIKPSEQLGFFEAAAFYNFELRKVTSP